jgi:hypothetical protein
MIFTFVQGGFLVQLALGPFIVDDVRGRSAPRAPNAGRQGGSLRPSLRAPPKAPQPR